MRLLTLVAGDAGSWPERFSRAMERWNRGLDIRLRFLNLGMDETVETLEESAGAGEPEATALEQVEDAIVRVQPAVVLLHGHGPVALSAAVSASKACVPILRTGAGRRDGDGAAMERATDRLARALVCGDDTGRGNLEADGLGDSTRSVNPEVDEEMDALLREIMPRLRRR